MPVVDPTTGAVRPLQVRDLQDDPEFHALPDPDRQQVFEVVSAEDLEFQQLPDPDRIQVRDVVLGVLPGGPNFASVAAGSPQPGQNPTYADRVGRRLSDFQRAAPGIVEGPIDALAGVPFELAQDFSLEGLGRGAARSLGGVAKTLGAIGAGYGALTSPLDASVEHALRGVGDVAGLPPEKSEDAAIKGAMAFQAASPIMAGKLAQGGRLATAGGATGRVQREVLGIPEGLEAQAAGPLTDARFRVQEQYGGGFQGGIAPKLSRPKTASAQRPQPEPPPPSAAPAEAPKLRAAVKIDDEIYGPADTHAAIVEKLPEGWETRNVDDGFVDEGGRYYTRAEAEELTGSGESRTVKKLQEVGEEGEPDPATLPPAEEVARRAQAMVDADLLGLVAEYRKRYGKVISSDDAKELFEDYSSSRTGRSLFSAAVHEPASQIAKEAFRQMLEEKPKPGELPRVLFTAGATGVGKTTALKSLPGLAKQAQIVYDTNLANVESSAKKFEQAYAKGKDIQIVYVHSTIEKAFKQALGRATRHGRTVPIVAGHIDTHNGSPKAVPELVARYKDDPRGFGDPIVLDNRGEKAVAGDLSLLDGVSYNVTDERQRLTAELERAYAAGEIPRRVYEGFLREPPAPAQVEPQGLGAAGREGHAGQPEPADRGREEGRAEAGPAEAEPRQVAPPAAAEPAPPPPKTIPRRGQVVISEPAAATRHQQEGLPEITATVNGREVGHVTYEPHDGYLRVHMIDVDEKYRRQGIATQLYEKMLEANPGFILPRTQPNARGFGFREAFDKKHPDRTTALRVDRSDHQTALKKLVAERRKAEKKKAAPLQPPASPRENVQALRRPTEDTPSRRATAKTERGTEIDTEYRIVDADELIASHDTTLRPDSRFPAELQPRDRSRAASEAQIQKIATKLEPSFLGESPKASEGAPIVGPDGKIVESGNARVIALKRVYAQIPDNAEKYRTWLRGNAANFGLSADDVAGVKNPVLVRVRTSELADAKRFVAEANESGVAAMSSTEQALADAKRLSDSAIKLLEPDDLAAAGNRAFVKAFMRDAVGPTDLGRYVDASGAVSQEGIRRIQNAVLAKAYGDPDVLEKFTESTDSNIRNIAAGLLQAAPGQVGLRRGVDAGELHDLALTDELAGAVKKLSFLKESGTKVEDYLSQQGLFGADLGPEARQLLVVLNQFSRSPKRIGQFLDAYAHVVEGAGNPKQSGLFAKEPISRSDAIAKAIERVDTLEAADGQAALFTDRTLLERAKEVGEARVSDAPVLRAQPEEARATETPRAGSARGGEQLPGERAPEPVAETDRSRPPATEKSAKGLTRDEPAPFRVIEGGKGKEKPPPPSAPGGSLEEPILKEPLSRRAVQATEDLFLSGKIERDPDRLISDQVMEAIAEEKVPLPELEEVLRKRGLTFVDFAEEMFRPAVTDAARRLNALAILQRKINLLHGTKGAKAELKKLKALQAELREHEQPMGILRRIDSIRRGLLVTQLKTTARNIESQGIRALFDVPDAVMQATYQRIVKHANRNDPTFKLAADPVRALDGLEQIGTLFGKATKKQADEILAAFPGSHNQLLGRYQSDLVAAAAKQGYNLPHDSRLLKAGEDAVEILNMLNRAQEFFFRRGFFVSKLSQRLAGRGLDLADVVKGGEKEIRKSITREDIAEASTWALERTFSKSPETSFGRSFVKVMSTPGLTLLTPFPRFMVNSMKFLFDYSPAGFVKLLGKKGAAKLAGGNAEDVTKAVIGSGMLLAAYGLRDSELAGEKWYEFKVGDRTVDIRPFNPFAAYFLLADLAVRKKKGTLYRPNLKEIVQAVFSANLRAGTGLYLLDQALDGLAGIDSPTKLKRYLAALAGETAGGFLVPVQQLGDLLAEFDPELRKMRDTRSDDAGETFTAPLKAKIPAEEIPGNTGLKGAKTLPERESATREATPRRESPVLGQISGLNILEPKNDVEKELDRLQFSPFEIMAKTGDVDFDRAVAKHMGPIVERKVGELVRGPKYRRATEAQKSAFLDEVLNLVNQVARAKAKAEDPRRWAKIRLDRLPRRTKIALEEKRPGLLEKR